MRKENIPQYSWSGRDLLAFGIPPVAVPSDKRRNETRMHVCMRADTYYKPRELARDPSILKKRKRKGKKGGRGTTKQEDPFPTFCNGAAVTNSPNPSVGVVYPCAWYSKPDARACVCTLLRLYCGQPPDKERRMLQQLAKIGVGCLRGRRRGHPTPFSYGVRAEHVVINNLLREGSKPDRGRAALSQRCAHLLLAYARCRRCRGQSIATRHDVFRNTFRPR